MKNGKVLIQSVLDINGHCIEDVIKALDTHSDKPKLILAKTIKGKGLKFAENNNNDWHHKK